MLGSYKLVDSRVILAVVVMTPDGYLKEKVMRNFILLGLMATVAIPVAAPAQSRSEIRRDRDRVEDQREELREAKRDGDRSDIREQREDLREARQELREDLRDRRRSEYQAPYRGWRYRTVQPGHTLRQAFYAPRYLVSNPGHYGVRPASRNRQWIRYGNDLLLVNVRNGRVLQVLAGRY
jgi:Ni/Co efflux regulator RcnB